MQNIGNFVRRQNTGQQSIRYLRVFVAVKIIRVQRTQNLFHPLLQFLAVIIESACFLPQTLLQSGIRFCSEQPTEDVNAFLGRCMQKLEKITLCDHGNL